MFKVNTGSAGFSLIEIMIVVVIIGLLAGLVGMTAPGILDRSRRKTVKVYIIALSNAVEMYQIDNGKYPESLEVLVAKKGSDEGYLTRLDKDPWGNPYIFQKPGVDGGSYSIESFGADGIDGGDGRNRDIESWNLNEEG